MEQLYKPRKMLSNKYLKEDLYWECTIEEFIVANKNTVSAYTDRLAKLCFSKEQAPSEARANIVKNLMVALRYPQFRHIEQMEICRLFDEKHLPETMPMQWFVKQLVYSDNIFEPISHEEIEKSIKDSKKSFEKIYQKSKKRNVKNE